MICETGKKCFDNRHQAMKSSKYIARQKLGSRKKKMRAYRCDLCKSWHLTQWEKTLKKKGYERGGRHSTVKKWV